MALIRREKSGAAMAAPAAPLPTPMHRHSIIGDHFLYHQARLVSIPDKDHSLESGYVHMSLYICSFTVDSTSERTDTKGIPSHRPPLDWHMAMGHCFRSHVQPIRHATQWPIRHATQWRHTVLLLIGRR